MFKKIAYGDLNLQGNDRANIKAGLSLKVGQVHVTKYCTRIQLRYEVTLSDIWTIADFTSKIFSKHLARKLQSNYSRISHSWEFSLNWPVLRSSISFVCCNSSWEGFHAMSLTRIKTVFSSY